MNILKNTFPKKTILWLSLFIVIFLAAATVYGLMPGISLNSPTSFPVDI